MSKSDESLDDGKELDNVLPLWHLPAVADDHLSWVRAYVDDVLGPYSDWSQEEKAELSPGCQLLVELAEGALDMAIEDYEAVRDEVTVDLTELHARARAADPVGERNDELYGNGSRAVRRRAEHDRLRAGVRRAVQYQLEGTVELARDLGIADDDLMALLRAVLSRMDAGPEPVDAANPSASIIELAQRRRPSGPPRRSVPDVT